MKRSLDTFTFNCLSASDIHELFEMNVDFIMAQARQFQEKTALNFEFDDIFQEMCMAFIQKVGLFDKSYSPTGHAYKNVEQHFGGWLKTILRNHAHDRFIRTTMREKDVPVNMRVTQVGDSDDISYDLDLIIGKNMTMAQQESTMRDFDLAEKELAIKEVIDRKLDAEDRAIIGHSFGILGYEELTQEEIGKRLGKEQGVISKRKKMILNRLSFSELRHYSK